MATWVRRSCWRSKINHFRKNIENCKNLKTSYSKWIASSNNCQKYISKRILSFIPHLSGRIITMIIYHSLNKVKRNLGEIILQLKSPNLNKLKLSKVTLLYKKRNLSKNNKLLKFHISKLSPNSKQSLQSMIRIFSLIAQAKTPKGSAQ